VLKHDLRRGLTTARKLGERQSIGEVVFVPNSPHSPEDDGVLMGYVHDAVPDRSDLVLLDASSLEMIAAIHLPVRVPFGFHGNWLPSAPRPTTH
jgi:carotenoid cleavage dioxygenase